MLSKAKMHYRLGLVLILSGTVVMIACFAVGWLTGSSGDSTLVGFLTYVIGTGGFALFVAGAVFLKESSAFLRHNTPTG